MLIVEVEYLLGRVFAAAFGDSAEPEWPPHPARLFSALVAAYHDGNGSEQERQALLWLERQEPPRIAAKAPGVTEAEVTFVPTNYPSKSGGTLPEQRAKQPRWFPSQGPESPVVWFAWPRAEVPAGHAKALRELTSRVASLGRACSLVRMNLVESIEDAECPASYVPDDDGQEVLRVASSGRLEELERTFQFGRRPTQGTLTRYRRLDGKNAPAEAARGHFGEMIVMRKVRGTGFPIECATLLTRRLRDAFLSRAGEGKPLSPVLSGHEGDKPATSPHVAFAALPNVGHEYSDGRLMGVAVILPAAIGRADRRTALRACASIESIHLGEKSGDWELEVAGFDVKQSSLKPETWTRAARRWQTVTPLLLDRYPKKHFGTEELIVTACVRAGLPEPAKCVYGPFSALAGVPPASAFSPGRWAVHATLEFPLPVKGPVLAGAGRFFGMGLLKPLAKEDEK